VPRIRLDQLLTDRQLVVSRERARALILAGQVRVDGRPVTKAGTAVAIDAAIELTTPDHPYVGRGGLKLAHALDTFGIDVRGVRRSTSARRPADSPMSSCNAARHASSPSTSVMGKSTGSSARTRASS
jgi:ribosomal protein S4